MARTGLVKTEIEGTDAGVKTDFHTAQDDRRPDKVVVLLSGGADSTTLFYLMVDRFGRTNTYPVFFDYGQRHLAEKQMALKTSSRKLWSVDDNVMDVPGLHVIHIPQVFSGGRISALLPDSGVEMPSVSYQQMKTDYGMSSTYVPFRNGTMLSMATAHALNVGAGWVAVAIHGEDSRNWAYPDCTPEFIGAMSAAVWVGSDHKVRLIAPFQYESKGQIVDRGTKLGVAWYETLSCYNGSVPACGKCPTCIEADAAFRYAGFEKGDPRKY